MNSIAPQGDTGEKKMSVNKEAELLKDLPLFNKVDLAKLKLLAFTSERFIVL